MIFASASLGNQGFFSMDEPNGNQVEKKKPVGGLGLYYKSSNVNADITIPSGMFRRIKKWLDNNWMFAARWSAITLVAAFPTVYGVSLGNMTIADKQRISVLEEKAENHDNLTTKVSSLETTLGLKIIDYNKLDVRITALEAEIVVRKEVNEEDGKILERQAEEERDRQKRERLQERNKMRAEKLRKIGQLPELHAVPELPAPDAFLRFRGVKND